MLDLLAAAHAHPEKHLETYRVVSRRAWRVAHSAETVKTFPVLQRCLLDPIHLYFSASKTRVGLKHWKVHKISDDRKCKTEFGKKKYFRKQQHISKYRPKSSQR